MQDAAFKYHSTTTVSDKDMKKRNKSFLFTKIGKRELKAFFLLDASVRRRLIWGIWTAVSLKKACGRLLVECADWRFACCSWSQTQMHQHQALVLLCYCSSGALHMQTRALTPPHTRKCRQNGHHRSCCYVATSETRTQ